MNQENLEWYGEKDVAIVSYEGYRKDYATKLYEFEYTDKGYRKLVYFSKITLTKDDKDMIKKMLAKPEEFSRYMGRSQAIEPVLLWLMQQYE
jgi:hypothetical protein